MSEIQRNTREEVVLKAVETFSLCKKFSEFIAVNDLSLSIGTGETFTLLGANGAGKTTTINLLTTLIKPTSGTGTIYGHDIIRHAREIKAIVALLPQGSAIDPFLNVYDNLAFYSMLCGLNKEEWTKKANEILEMLDLSSKKRSNPFSLSGGQLRRVQIARVLLSNAALIFLDEPTLGVDIEGKFKIWEIIKKWQRETERTVILSTNDMEEAEYLSDRIGFLRQGSIISIGTSNELKEKASFQMVRIKYQSPVAPVAELNGCKARAVSNDTLLFHLDKRNVDIAPLLTAAGGLGAISDVAIEKPSLSEAFLQIQGEVS
jgi:ABC-2 type transport system ATP-binding protein